MTLKNILQWEISRATVGPCCLINRDFKRQCGISMVLQGSAKGQAVGVEEKGGEEDKYSVLTPQPFTKTPTITRVKEVGAQQLTRHCIKTEHSHMHKKILKSSNEGLRNAACQGRSNSWTNANLCCVRHFYVHSFPFQVRRFTSSEM